jgi:hypothetical protein
MKEGRLRKWMAGAGNGIYGVDAGLRGTKVLYARISFAA